jgi:hypothetical protein
MKTSDLYSTIYFLERGFDLYLSAQVLEECFALRLGPGVPDARLYDFQTATCLFGLGCEANLPALSYT